MGVSILADDFTCVNCHSSCATCYWGRENFSCNTCKEPNTRRSDYTYGYICQCAYGFQPQSSQPASACQPCANGCFFCVGPAASDCVSLDEYLFLLVSAFPSFSLPITSTTGDKICYRTSTVGSDCLLQAINYGAGTSLGSALDSLTATSAQCKQLLSTQWPEMVYWYNTLFPTMVWPAGGNVALDFTNYFTTPILWLLEFGPSQLLEDATWQALLTDLNSLGEADWTNVLAWGGAESGYTINGGTTIKTLPAGLQGKFTENSPEADFFNSNSSVCEEVFSHCSQAGLPQG